MGDGCPGIDSALPEQHQLLRCLKTLLGTFNVGFGSGQSRAVGERVLDHCNSTLGAHPLAGVQRTRADIADDRRGRRIDPAGDCGIAKDDRAEIGTAYPPDVDDERRQGDEARGSLPVQPKHLPPAAPIIALPGNSGKPRQFKRR